MSGPCSCKARHWEGRADTSLGRHIALPAEVFRERGGGGGGSGVERTTSFVERGQECGYGCGGGNHSTAAKSKTRIFRVLLPFPPPTARDSGGGGCGWWQSLQVK